MANVGLGRVELAVPDHPFWEKFAAGWEPDTERVYRNWIGQGATVIDIGAWIGPTILYALACGAEKIVALEPNPGSMSLLQRMAALNPQTMAGVTLINKAVASRAGPITMGLPEGEPDTSMFGIAGGDLQAEATTLSAILAEHAPEGASLIKIDIEGAEALLLDDLAALGGSHHSAIHLSIHVPFFPKNADIPRMADALGEFTIHDDRGEKLSPSDLKGRLLSTQKHPPWGTQHGNFFELILVP